MLLKTYFIAACAAWVALSAPAFAQDKYPSRPINLIVPLTPGITLDVIARLYADKMSKVLWQPVVVMNRPGAGGIIGAQSVATAPADGYTLLMTNTGHVILPVLNKNLPFDPLNDFKGISLIADTPSVVIVHPSLGVKNLKEFVALAKAKPGTINYASAGIATPTHIAGAYFAQQAGIDLVHIPYKMSADIISDLLGARVQAVFAPPAYVLSMLKDGKLLPLAVGTTTDLKEPIAIPSARSQGVEYINTTWYGMLAPAKTPPAVLKTLEKAILQVSKDPEVQEKLKLQGLNANQLALNDFDAFLKKEATRLAPVLKSADTK